MTKRNTVKRTGVRRKVSRDINAASAADAVGPIEQGMEVYGVSKAQFSLIELVMHCLDTTGPADLVISTWTAAGADLAHTHDLLASGAVRSCRWLVDFSFPSRQPAYCKALRERFGDDAIACVANHAKFVTIVNDDWHIAIRTSMNLNLNRRLESFEISDDSRITDWLGELVESCFANGSTIDKAVRSPSAAQGATAHVGGTLSFAGMEHNGANTKISYGTVPGVSHD